VFYEGIKYEAGMCIKARPIFMVFMEDPKDRLLPSNSSIQAASVHSFAGASAGTIATIITHPFDVIKVSRHK
jgi:hypothetical protein